VFMLISVEALHESNKAVDLLVAMAGWAILLSVILHAVTASPLAHWYAHRLESAPPDAAEFLPTTELSAHHQRTSQRTLGSHTVPSNGSQSAASS